MAMVRADDRVISVEVGELPKIFRVISIVREELNPVAGVCMYAYSCVCMYVLCVL